MYSSLCLLLAPLLRPRPLLTRYHSNSRANTNGSNCCDTVSLHLIVDKLAILLNQVEHFYWSSSGNATSSSVSIGVKPSALATGGICWLITYRKNVFLMVKLLLITPPELSIAPSTFFMTTSVPFRGMLDQNTKDCAFLPEAVPVEFLPTVCFV
jgi:hypothetical protein